MMLCPVQGFSVAERLCCGASSRDEVGSPQPAPWRQLSPRGWRIFQLPHLCTNLHPSLYLPEDASTCTTASIRAPPARFFRRTLYLGLPQLCTHLTLRLSASPAFPPVCPFPAFSRCRVLPVLSPAPTQKSSFAQSPPATLAQTLGIVFELASLPGSLL